MTLDVYLISYNNETIVPFVMQYWTRIQPVHIYVYDNDSNDRTVELLQQYQNVKVIPFHTHEQYDPYTVCRIKNKCWRASQGKADYVFVGNFDEVLHGYDVDVNTFLQYIDKIGVTVVGLSRWNLISYNLPEYNESALLHDADGVTVCKSQSKNDVDRPVLFKPEKMIYLNIDITKEVNIGGEINYYDTDLVRIYHLRDIDVDMTVARFQNLTDRVLLGSEELVEFKTTVSSLAKEKNYRKKLDKWIEMTEQAAIGQADK